jgi:U3 small nucleolar RNA-associated protein 24
MSPGSIFVSDRLLKDILCSPQIASSLFLQHNTALVPPYRVLIDTNFINFSLQNKLELISGMMDCLYAKCVCSSFLVL